MIKYVKCIDNTYIEEYLTKDKIYEVIEVSNVDTYYIKDDNNGTRFYSKTHFVEVKEQKTENSFKFIPEAEIQYVTVNGVKGILIKEE